MSVNKEIVTVYYDGSCPGCVKDLRRYEALARKYKKTTRWVDITNKEEELKKLGIDPGKALRELHVVDANGTIVSEMDAYILLMRRTFWLKFFAWFIGLPFIKPMLAKIYRWWVDRRLVRTGRM